MLKSVLLPMLSKLCARLLIAFRSFCSSLNTFIFHFRSILSLILSSDFALQCRDGIYYCYKYSFLSNRFFIFFIWCMAPLLWYYILCFSPAIFCIVIFIKLLVYCNIFLNPVDVPYLKRRSDIYCIFFGIFLYLLGYLIHRIYLADFELFKASYPYFAWAFIISILFTFRSDDPDVKS